MADKRAFSSFNTGAPNPTIVADNMVYEVFGSTPVVNNNWFNANGPGTIVSLPMSPQPADGMSSTAPVAGNFTNALFNTASGAGANGWLIYLYLNGAPTSISIQLNPGDSTQVWSGPNVAVNALDTFSWFLDTGSDPLNVPFAVQLNFVPS